MYEEPNTPALRHVLSIIVTIVIIAAVLWAGAWFFFLRNHSTTGKSPSPKTKQQASQSTPKAPSGRSTNGTTKPNGSSTNGSAPIQSSNGNATSNPGQLANAGAGNVLMPVFGGVVGGIVVYQVHLRRRAVSPDA